MSKMMEAGHSGALSIILSSPDSRGVCWWLGHTDFLSSYVFEPSSVSLSHPLHPWL